MENKELREHDIIVKSFCKNSDKIANLLNLPKVWVRATEHPIFDENRVDIVFQDYFNPYRHEKEKTTCYIVEVKSDRADHEVLGQIEKGIIAFKKIGKNMSFWKDVKGLCVAPSITKSAKKILEENNHKFINCKKLDYYYDFFIRKSI